MSLNVGLLSRAAGLTNDEVGTLNAMVSSLERATIANDEAESYYEAQRRFSSTLIIPDQIKSAVNAVIGWAGTVVDVLEERLDWLGWSETDDLGLSKIYDANTLGVDSGLAHLDALIFGVSFVRVGSGDDGEPHPLITTHSPYFSTGVWSRRTRRLSSALTLSGDRKITTAYLDSPDEAVTLIRNGDRWAAEHRDKHNLGRVPVVQLPNRPRGSRAARSEITRAVRYYCDAAVRVLLGMEANREVYSIPQILLLGRGKEAFEGKSSWEVVAGRALAIDRDEAGDLPEVKQLVVGSPAPFLAQIEGFAQLLAAEAAIPSHYLGFITDNPASADAIRAGEARLVKRAERRQNTFGRAWREVARLALLIRDGSAPEDFDSRFALRWRDAATPTRAAAADEATKLVGSNILSADSTITYDRIGLSPAEQKQLSADKTAGRQTSVAALIDAIGRQTIGN